MSAWVSANSISRAQSGKLIKIHYRTHNEQIYTENKISAETTRSLLKQDSSATLNIKFHF